MHKCTNMLTCVQRQVHRSHFELGCRVRFTPLNNYLPSSPGYVLAFQQLLVQVRSLELIEHAFTVHTYLHPYVAPLIDQ